MTLNEIQKLIRFAKKNNVSHLKCDGIEFDFTQKQKIAEQNKSQSKDPIDIELAREEFHKKSTLSLDDLATWSAT